MRIKLKSRIPDKDKDKVLGIGVADKEITCARGANDLNFSYCCVPNFCSSS